MKLKAREERPLSLVSDGLQPLVISLKSDSVLKEYPHFSLTLALQVAVNSEPCYTRVEGFC